VAHLIEDEDLFERHRSQLRGVAFRLLGSFADVDDVLQEAWLRSRGVDLLALDNPGAWLTTVVGRLSLNRLRDRAAQRTVLETRFPDVVVSPDGGADPEAATVLGDDLGVALLVVLDALSPDERVAFVLHDAFAVPFGAIAEVLGATPAAARQLASRGRRKVAPAAPRPRDPRREREAVRAFLAAAERGDFDALLAVLHPDAVLRSDGGAGRPSASVVLRGAAAIAGGALRFRALGGSTRPVLVHGDPAVLVAPRGVPLSLMVFTVVEGEIRAIDVLADADRLRGLVKEPAPPG
jgi:RNA polymerase sigma factor (sigma-70 family)